MIICYLLLPRRKKTVLLSLSKPQGDKWWRLCVRYSGQNGPQHTVYTLLHIGAFITSEIRRFCIFGVFFFWSKTLIMLQSFYCSLSLKRKIQAFLSFSLLTKNVYYVSISLSLFSIFPLFLLFFIFLSLAFFIRASPEEARANLLYSNSPSLHFL